MIAHIMITAGKTVGMATTDGIYMVRPNSWVETEPAPTTPARCCATRQLTSPCWRPPATASSVMASA